MCVGFGLQETTTMAKSLSSRVEKDVLHISVLTQVVVLGIPRLLKERKNLEKYLKKMGCQELLARPWNLKDQGFVRELIMRPPNQNEHTMKSKPSQWTVTLWKEVYCFSKVGASLVSRTNNVLNNKFKNLTDPKDKFP